MPSKEKSDMRTLRELFDNNKAWADGVIAEDPDFFTRLSQRQSPEYLWIGCADSRVPANQIVGLAPGDVFVHRNVANIVVHSDVNCLSVIEYAVAILKVRHIIVCGHYGCGGVRAALENHALGLIDNWLRHLRDVRQKHIDVLNRITDDEQRLDLLCELNVVEQVQNVCSTTIVQQAWQNGQELSVHGWIYGLHNGRIQAVSPGISGPDEISDVYRIAVSSTHAG
jgi:carbonic anhydrase